MERPPLEARGRPTERSSLKSPHTTPCEGHKLLLTRKWGTHCDPKSLLRGSGRCGGVTHRGLAVWVAPAGEGLGSEEAELLFLLLLLPLGHAVEILLGFPKDILEVSV